MNILGLSSHFHDAAACLLKDGELVAAAQEERFTRIKHDASMPKRAVRYCLQEAGLGLSDIEVVAYYEDPWKKLERQLWMGLPEIPVTSPRRLHTLDPRRPERAIREILGLECPILYYDHHKSHAASAYFYSGFPEAALLTVDGVGEWDTLTYGKAAGAKLELLGNVQFPHSIGLLYSTLTAYLGFEVNDGEYKVMGLAPYGEPRYVERLRRLVTSSAGGDFALDPKYFAFANMECMFTPALEELLGRKARTKEMSLTAFHHDLARSLQVLLEDLLLEKARFVHELTGAKNLCMAGGVALNCVANARLRREGPFQDLFVQPAASDAGSCLGAAALAYTEKTGERPRGGKLRHLYLGPSFPSGEVRRLLGSSDLEYLDFGDDEPALLTYVAGRLAEGAVAGWFNGRMEFGPRALGSRSIVADPRRTGMRDRINAAVKKREGFRPFAPSVLEEATAALFDLDRPSPFMLETCPVRDRTAFPAITHCDGSARVQTVNEEDNGRYYRLVKAFEERTGCPLLLNTSFNLRGEPIVHTPLEALLCFIRSDLDLLVLGDVVLERAGLSAQVLAWYGGTAPLWREGVSNAVYTFL